MGLQEQAAHRLDRFPQSHKMYPGNAVYREGLVSRLTGMLLDQSIRSKEVSRERLVAFLKSCVPGDPDEVMFSVGEGWTFEATARVLARLADAHVEFVGFSPAELAAPLDSGEIPHGRHAEGT